MAEKKKPDIAASDAWKDKDSIATRVVELRQEKKWSQTQLAEEIGVNRAQISRLESGETKSLHSDLLVKLAKVFGVSTDYLLCLTRQPNARYTDVDKLGLSEEAAKKLMSGSIDADVLNRLLEHKSFGTLCDQIRIYYNDTYTEGYLGRNELLDFGSTSLKQYVQEHPDKRADTRETLLLLNAQKASADEINTEKISKGFMKMLSDIRTDIRKKKPTTPNATHEAMATIQAGIADKPRSAVTPDDIADGVMAVLDSKHTLQPGVQKVIERFVRWFMRHFSGARHNHPSKQFQTHQELMESLDEDERAYKGSA